MHSLQRLHLREPEWAAAPGRVPSLDGLRGVSIALVLLGHILLPAPFLGISALGLKLCFFLSGFLITRLLLAEWKARGAISLAGFYQRRMLRLYPVIGVYLGVVTAVTLAKGLPVAPIELAAVFFYFVNYLGIHHLHSGGTMSLPIEMLWSLSVEEHFYLIAPLALVLLRARPQAVLALAAGVCGLSLALRLIHAQLDPGIVDTLELYWRSETRFDSIAYGVALAALPEWPAGRAALRRLATPGAFALGLLLLLGTYAVRDPAFQNTWRFTIQGLALMPVVASLVFVRTVAPAQALLNRQPLVWLGQLSYSLYVWHGGITLLFGRWLDAVPPAVMPTLKLGLAFALACASYYAVERPVLRWRDRRVRRRRAAPGLSAAA